MSNDDKKTNEPQKGNRRPFVNNKCIWCWACVSIAEDVFYFTEDWLSKARKDLDNYEWLWVEDAIEGCPLDAIEWIEKRN